MAPEYEALLREHEQIVALVEDLVARARDGQANAAAKTLQDLTLAVAMHLANEDTTLYGRLQADTGEEDRVADTERAFESLKDSWERFVSHWDPEAIERDFTGFQAAANAILPLLRERVATETALLGRSSGEAGRAQA